MPKTVSASEAQARLGSMVQWVDENDDGVIIERRGTPAAAIISYTAFEELMNLRKQQKRRQALEAIRQIREQVQAVTPELTEEEAYRLAGFSEQPLQELVEYDRTHKSTS